MGACRRTRLTDDFRYSVFVLEVRPRRQTPNTDASHAKDDLGIRISAPNVLFSSFGTIDSIVLYGNQITLNGTASEAFDLSMCKVPCLSRASRRRDAPCETAKSIV